MRSSAGGGWRGVVLIAVIYVYFLIFAQFGFLARLAELGIAANGLKIVMAAMAAGGILLSLVTPRARVAADAALRLRVGLLLCATAAVLTLLPLGIVAAALVAFLIGAGLGVSTVTLVTHLRMWTGERRGILFVGLGTGIAYLTCNVPAVFTARPSGQAVVAAMVCVLAAMMPLGAVREEAEGSAARVVSVGFPVALASFAALIWLDSAAFYIIQHTDALKAGTWLGSAHLWTNGALHFGAAVSAGVLLQRGRSWATLALAFLALGFACVLLRNPALILSASLFYPVGVSLYSVALVAYPSFLARAESVDERGRQAGWIYAIGGWVGSALGIGMGQNLGYVPLAFVAVAGVVVLGPVWVMAARSRAREMALVGVAAAAAFLAYRAAPQRHGVVALTAVERGRQVYISEGCISCHSQYVRPNSGDVEMWGPVESLEEIHKQKPPLIGNRRQGPDLAEVGVRRSRLWLKGHLVNPREVSYRSPMPSYAFLFANGRGDDLVAYLASLRTAGTEEQLRREAAWQPGADAWRAASAAEGERVWKQHCATCHDATGAARERWRGQWSKLPPSSAEVVALTADEPLSKIAQIAKFGIPGTDMAGHEYLSDEQIASAALWVRREGTGAQNSGK